MNKLQKIGGVIALAGALSGCGDPINNDNKFSQWTPEQTHAILNAPSLNELVKVPDLEKNIKKWVATPYNTWKMQVMQTTESGIAGVEQNSSVNIKFGNVGKGAFFARFTNPADPKDYKDFAVVCANGMLRGMNNLSFSEPVSIPETQTRNMGSGGISVAHTVSDRVIRISEGDSLMGLGMTLDESKNTAGVNGLKEFNKNGKYIVKIQPGDEFKQSNDGTWKKAR